MTPGGIDSIRIVLVVPQPQKTSRSKMKQVNLPYLPILSPFEDISQTPSMVLLLLFHEDFQNKNFLLAGKSIRNGKGMVNKKNRANGKGMEGIIGRKWNYESLDFTKGDKGKRRGRLAKFCIFNNWQSY